MCKRKTVNCDCGNVIFQELIYLTLMSIYILYICICKPRKCHKIVFFVVFGIKDKLAEFLNVSENWAELECQGDAAFKYSNWELSCVEWTRVAELIHV